MANTIDAKLDFDFVADLSRFEQKIKDQVLFTGVAAMARVIYAEVKLNAAPPRLGMKTGNLLNSIYRVYSPEKSSDSQKTYRVSYNKKKAPHGHLIEFGTSRAPAHPFLRPAFDRVDEAIRQGKVAMAQRLQGGST